MKKRNQIKKENMKIFDLFQELDNFDKEIFVGNNADLYWDIKVRLVCEITKKYGPQGYDPETIKVLNIPCALLSTIVNMERMNLMQ